MQPTIVELLNAWQWNERMLIHAKQQRNSRDALRYNANALVILRRICRDCGVKLV